MDASELANEIEQYEYGKRYIEGMTSATELTVNYDDIEDALTIGFLPRLTATMHYVHYVGLTEMALLVNEDDEVIGLRIENFKWELLKQGDSALDE